MTTIVVGVDATERSDAALAFARRFPDAELVSACSVPVDGTPPQRLDAVTRVLVDGSPARALHTLAETKGADLIVVGSSHTGRLGRVLPGSTGEKLLHGSPCAVAVVPSGYEPRPVERIGVAYDGSDEAKAALATATRLAKDFGADLELVGVAALDSYAGPAIAGGAGYELDTLRVETEKRIRDSLDQAVGAVDADTVLLDGDPARMLAERTRTLDLIVTGSRGYGPLHAVLVGAVSGQLIRSAHCPVVVVPRGAARDIAQAA